MTRRNLDVSGLEPPRCRPPNEEHRPPRRMKMPYGAVDAHSHIIGEPPRYPFVEDRSYTPPPARLESYIEMLDRTGFTYGVLIQVSVHGTDNGLMQEALRRYRKRLRGVAVTPLGLPAGDYDELKRDGVVALRLNKVLGGGIGYEDLEKYDRLARDLGWHIQLLVHGDMFEKLGRRLAHMKSRVVIDHMGRFSTGVSVSNPAFRELVAFVRDGGWVKLSGAFRNSEAGMPYADTVPFAQALLEAGPDRCVWGSDWPHVVYDKPMPVVADLVDLLVDYAPDEELRKKVLVSNPADLYGF